MTKVSKELLDPIGAGQIDTGAVDTDELADGAVTTAKLDADAVDDTKLADNAVGNEHLQNSAVDTAEIADNAVTLAKLAGGTAGNFIGFNGSGDPASLALSTIWSHLGATDFGAAADNESIYTDLDTTKAHLFIFDGILPATSGSVLRINTSADTGGSPTMDTSGAYDHLILYGRNDGSTELVGTNKGFATANCNIMPASLLDPYPFSFKILCLGLPAGETFRAIGFGGFRSTSSLRYVFMTSIARTDTNAVNAIRFFTHDSNNMDDGSLHHLTLDLT